MNTLEYLTANTWAKLFFCAIESKWWKSHMFKENSLFPWRKIRLICLLFYFQVVYKEKDSDSPLQFWMVEGNASHSVQLTRLESTFCTRSRCSPSPALETADPALLQSWSEPLMMVGTTIHNKQTVAFLNNQMCLYKFMIYLFSVPGPPVVILFPEVRTTSVRLIWQPPSQPNGIILGTRVCLCVWVCMHFFLLVFIRTCLSSEWPLFTIKRWNIPEYFQLWLLTDHTRANIHKHVKTNTEYHTKIIDPVF